MISGIIVIVIYGIAVGYTVITCGDSNMDSVTRSEIHRFIH